ncbi:MAG: InlB B-repeat-containing protein [Lachnospiraceae bacterium]|nr:InlB B-repeat-containing protein [Lachnospiraceae bacterium]
MKYSIYGVVLMVLAVLAIASGMVVSGKDIRENEMDKALNTAVEQTMEQLNKEGGYEIRDAQELIADFHQSLLLHISSDSDLEVKILTADTEKGVLDVEVRQTYQTLRGTKKEAVCRKTVLLEQYSDKQEYCVVEFLVNGTIYDKYTIYPGGSLSLPPEPKAEGHVFRGWKRMGSQGLALDGMCVEESMSFQAEFL